MTSNVKRRFRIGIDARMYRRATGGLGRYTRELLHHLLPLDEHNEYVIFLTDEDVPEWDIVQPNVRIVVSKAVHYTPQEQTVFLKELLKEKLDLVHFLNFNHPILYPKPFVVTLHDLTMFLFPAHGSRKTPLYKKLGFQAIFRRAVRSAKKVIAISEYSAFDAEKRLKVPHAKMEVVYEGGPEPVRFLPGSKDMAQKFVGTREPYILFVSQFRPHKGIVTLIEAFDRFKKATNAPHKLVLVGNPEAASDEVRKALVEAEFASDIIAPGFVSDDLLPALFHYATCFVMPSEYEGFGLPVLEAYAHGTPVIAANNSSLPEVVGDGGLLFSTKDSAALADLLIRLCGDAALQEKLVNKGMEHLKKFSWKRAAEQTLAVYRSVLEKQR